MVFKEISNLIMIIIIKSNIVKQLNWLIDPPFFYLKPKKFIRFLALTTTV